MKADQATTGIIANVMSEAVRFDGPGLRATQAISPARPPATPTASATPRWRSKDTAIAVLRKNVDVYPDAFNPHDSLGEALMLKGDREEAIRCYARSLVLNPENTNAIEMLQKLKK